MNLDYDLGKIVEVASTILKKASTKKLLFYGAMGTGKTTLIKEICKQLGSKDTIASPTFSLVNEYQTSLNQPIYHFDFYRIENQEEALDIGIDDYFSTDAWCFIEWPQNIENLLPLEATIIKLTVLNNGKRNLQLN